MEIEELTEKYDLHDIIIEDLEETSTQDKIDVYDDCLFIVLHFPKFEKEKRKYTMNEFNCILGKNYIATITKYKTSFIEIIKQEYTNELKEDKEDGYEVLYKISPYYILYRIIDAMYEKTLLALKNFTIDLASIENKIFEQDSADTMTLEELMKKRRNIVTLKHSINPQSEIITELQKETIKIF